MNIKKLTAILLSVSLLAPAAGFRAAAEQNAYTEFDSEKIYSNTAEYDLQTADIVDFSSDFTDSESSPGTTPVFDSGGTDPEAAPAEPADADPGIGAAPEQISDSIVSDAEANGGGNPAVPADSDSDREDSSQPAELPIGSDLIGGDNDASGGGTGSSNSDAADNSSPPAEPSNGADDPIGSADDPDDSADDPSSADNADDRSLDRYIVVYDSLSGSDDDQFLRASACSADEDGLLYDVMELTSEQAAALEQSDNVSYIEKDHQITAFDDFDHSDVGTQQISAQSSSQIFNWGYYYINAAAVPAEYKGQGVKIAVLDSGISPHADLEIAGGVSFVDYTSSYSDDNGHGTHVAGIIAAKDNDIGIVGIAPEASIYSVKVLGSDGKGNYSSLIKGIEWSIRNGMDIINLSLGGKEASPTLEKYVKRAADAGILVIAAAGNYGPARNTVTYPAKYAHTVAVASSDKYSNVSGFSGRGSEIDITAPGSAIESLSIKGNAYELRNGTSQAAPFVAAAAAVMLSKNSSASAEQIMNAIYAGATALNTTDADCVGHGLLNLPRAIAALDAQTGYQEPTEPAARSQAADYDIRITQYKEKLKIYRDTALANGDVYLSKEINQCLEEIVQSDLSARSLCMAEADDSIDKSDCSDATVNAAFYQDPDLFYSLEEYYRLTVQSFSERFADSIRKSNCSGAQSSGGTIYQAKPVKVNSSGSNVFEFTPESDGIYVISTTYYNKGAVVNDTYLELFDSPSLGADDRIACNDDSGGSLFSSIAVHLKAGKTYYILLRNSSDGGTVYAELNVLNQFPSISAGDYSDISTGPGEHMIYGFTPDSDGKYTIKTGRYGGIGACCDTLLYVYDDSALQHIIAYNDESGNDGFSAVNLSLSAGRRYYIKVCHFDGDNGSIHARLTVSPSASPIGISVGDTLGADIEAGAYNVYCFTPNKTALYKLSAQSQSASNSSDAYLELYRDSGLTKRIAFCDDCEGPPFSAITCQLNKDTKYYIKLSGYAGGKLNANISVERTADAISKIYTDCPTAVSLAKGDYALYKFTPSESGLYTVETSSASLSDTVISLYSDGCMTRCISFDDDSGRNTGSRITCDLSAGVCYFIRVSGYDMNSVRTSLMISK